MPASETKVCQNCKSEFIVEPEDFAFYEKIKVPPPTFCPECRFKRRLAWRNGRILFRRKDNASGNEMFSGFPPIEGITVYDHAYWKSDGWDPLAYGREYDFSRPFFEQYRELLTTVPWPSKSVQAMINSEYCDQAGYFKNAYLCFNGDRMEDSAYTTQCTDDKSCFDCMLSFQDELCYESVSVNGSYKTFFSQDCESCSDVWFSKNCVGCTDCFGCVGLRNKTRHFFNEPLGKDEYEHKIQELRINTWNGIQDAARLTREFFLKFPVKYFHGFRIAESTGDYLRNTKNVKSSYLVDDAQDGKYLYNLYMNVKDSYDYGPWGNASSLMYECLTCGDQCNEMKFCFESWPGSHDLEYCFFCRSSSHCFGCVSLKKKQYCILNKQYSEEEYGALRRKIIEHMDAMPYQSHAANRQSPIVYRYGEFTPPEFSPFAYNETALHDIYPLDKERAIREGYVWRDAGAKEFAMTMTADDLPETVNETRDSILNEVIQCGGCKRAYRIIEPELQFLRRMNLPLPRICVNCRYLRRFALINVPRYYRRRCVCAGKTAKSESPIAYRNTNSHFHGDAPCPNEFETSYAPGRPEIVYCEGCYNAEVA